MGGWARAARFKGAATRVCDMILVVGTVEILAIPAPASMLDERFVKWAQYVSRREGDSCADATSALLLGEIKGIISSAGSTAERILLLIAEAAVTELLLLPSLRAKTSVADEHAEPLYVQLHKTAFPSRAVTYLGKSSDLCLSVIGWDIVDGDTLLALEAQVHHLRHAFKGAVLRLEVQVCGPVVAEVFGVVARCARGGSGWVKFDRLHRRIESVTTDDLMHVGRRGHSRLHERVDTVVDEL